VYLFDVSRVNEVFQDRPFQVAFLRACTVCISGAAVWQKNKNKNKRTLENE
jgi:hypothetical protein